MSTTARAERTPLWRRGRLGRVRFGKPRLPRLFGGGRNERSKKEATS